MHELIGPYRVLDVLGRGASGTVYRAQHERLRRQVALKALTATEALGEHALHRFEREMRIAASLSHPCLAHVYDGDLASDPPYIAMELVEGVTLAELASASAPLPWEFTLAVLSRMAEGLQALHAHALVHRDVKPANVMLGRDGSVKLLDMGLVRAAAGGSITAPGVVLGTILYFAPEHIDGGDPTPACDLWAAGATAYRLLTGEQHLAGTSPLELFQAIALRPIVSPAQLEPSVHPEAARLVMALLDRDPAQRLGPASAVVEEVERVLAAAGTSVAELLTPAACAELPLVGGLASRTLGGAPGPLPGAEASAVTQAVAPGAGAPGAGAPAGADDPAGAGGPAGADAPAGPDPKRGSGVSRRPGSRSGVVKRSAPVRASFSRPGAEPAPAPVPARRARVAAVFGLTLLAGLAALLLRPPAIPTPAPGSPSPERPEHGSLFHEFTKIESDYAALKGPSARARAAEVRKRSPVDLSDQPEPYVWWVDLARWLAREDGSPPPHPPRPRRDTMDYVDNEIFQHLIRDSASDVRLLLAAGLRSTSYWPRDARGWFLLGRQLELDGCVREARATYAVALGVLGDRPLDTLEERIWAGWFQANLWLRRGAIKEAWLAQALASQNDSPFAQMCNLLLPAERELFDALLDAVPDRAPHHEFAVVVRAQQLIRQGRRKDSMDALLAEERKGRRVPQLLTQLVAHHLDLGDAAAARVLIDQLPADNLSRGYLVVEVGDAPARPLWSLARPRDTSGWYHEVTRLLYADAPQQAMQVVEQGRSHWNATVEEELAPLLVAHGVTGWVAEGCRKALERALGPSGDLLALGRMVSNLSYGAGPAWLLPELDRSSGVPARITYARAQLASRSGRLVDGIALIEAAAGDAGLAACVAADRGWLLELFARAHFAHRLGRSADARLRERVRALPMAASLMERQNDELAVAWKALAADREEEAARLAREQLANDPWRPEWGLLVAWSLAARPDAAALSAWVERLTLSWRRRWEVAWAVREVRELTHPHR